MNAINRIVVMTITLGTISAVGQAPWKPAAGPLMTRWAKDVSAETPLPEYPRPQMVRKDWANLNGLWDYAIAPKAEASPKEYQGKILVPFCAESALSGVMKPVGAANRLWYRRTFDRPKMAADGRLLLHFGAVDWEATVWVNGKEVGTHRGGFDPFTLDITGALRTNGSQELVVAVWDPTDEGPQPRGKQVKRPGGIMYTPVTGIWQTVWLEAVPKAYVKSLKITTDVDKSTVRVEIKVANAPAKLTFKVIAMEGQTPVQDDEPSVEDGTAVANLDIKNAKLWSPEQPYLYKLSVHMFDGDDDVEAYFGMRKIEVKKDDKGVNRVYLNNKAIFMAGPLDQGFWPDGIYTAPTDEALKYDVEVTKQLGFNTTRKHVKVEPARWYYWCDKLGLIVWQDMPSGDVGVGPGKGEVKRTGDGAAIYEAELRAMMGALVNHPSIVMWVVFNEGWGQFDTVRIANWTKREDPTRLINPASGWNDYPAGHVVDMHKYPAPGAPKAQADRASVLGEFGGLGLATPGHMWKNENWGYKGVKDQSGLTKQYVKLMSKAWQLRETEGLNAAIYTQITDVETEANGLLTYDRAVIKVDVGAVAEANRGKAAAVADVPPVFVTPTSEKAGLAWRYTTARPGEDWFKAGFDAGGWKEGKGGFGTEQTPGAVVRTRWDSADIWLRREFEVAALPKNPTFLMHHDEDVEVYINGVLAAKAGGYVAEYEEVEMTADGRAAIKAGRNVIAVHCHQTGGGQYVDVGILDSK